MRPRISIRGCVRRSVCLSVGRSSGRSVGLSVTLSLKLRKTAEFTENHGSLRERTTNQGSGSINESCTQSITHSNHSYTSQGASLAYVGLVHYIAPSFCPFLGAYLPKISGEKYLRSSTSQLPRHNERIERWRARLSGNFGSNNQPLLFFRCVLLCLLHKVPK